MNTAKIRELLAGLYGQDAGSSASEQLIKILDRFNDNNNARLSVTNLGGLDQRDTILITYPDQIQQADEPPLAVLEDFCRAWLPDCITGIHILPFYPWTSDDGFSVVDYREVDPRYGGWSDIELLGQNFKLMFDAVINHVSVKSAWFQSMLEGNGQYCDYFIVPGKNDDLTKVVRPRALPLLTEFQTTDGTRKVWTTFSADQVDLNYSNPEVLLEILNIVLLYISHGADFIRLDAIAYLWKEPGTSCIHLPQTHAIIQLIRAMLEEVAPHVMLITETNVPHADNISYFGNGKNEAHMVYNFSLPPLVLHAIHSGSAETLTRWATGLNTPSPEVTFFNFLASHDGIGLNPLRGILPEVEIEAIVDRIYAHGGLVSLKNDTDGTQRPYELNINYFDALTDPYAAEPLDTQVDRFMAAHAILLAMRGVPALYFHSLVGSRSWQEGAMASGLNRTINRRKFQRFELDEMLSDPSSISARVFQRLKILLKIRREHPAFHPYGSQEVLASVPDVFCLQRTSPDGKEQVLCLQNVNSRSVHVDRMEAPGKWTYDLIENNKLDADFPKTLKPYQTMWLIEYKD